MCIYIIDTIHDILLTFTKSGNPIPYWLPSQEFLADHPAFPFVAVLKLDLA